MTKSITDLVDLLKINCKARDIATDMDYAIYEQEIKEAIAAINRCRRFKPTDKKLYDLRYEDLIIPLAISSLAKIGAEGEAIHNENGILRTYNTDGKYPSSILKSIRPLAK